MPVTPRTTARLHGGIGHLFLALLTAWTTESWAAPPVEFSPDTSVAFGQVAVGPGEVAEDDLGALLTPVSLGVSLPPGVNVDAFSRAQDGSVLFSTDVAAQLGTLVAGPADVVRVTNGIPTLAFDANGKGLPPGVRLDAVTELLDGSLVVSFDVAVEIDGRAFADEDLARIESSTGFVTLWFSGSSAGVATGLDLDAADTLENDVQLAVSFDGSGLVLGAGFDDEDVLAFDGLTNAFKTIYDGSARSKGWFAADLDAADVALARDTDLDGLPDSVDNCPFFANPSQSDRGGVGAGSAPDGFGDACQCGDVNGSGAVTSADALMIRRALLVPPTATLNLPDLCDVGGSSGCSTGDSLIIRRTLLDPLVTQLESVCAPALPPLLP